MFTTEQEKQIQERGSDLNTVQQQIENFKQGFPHTKVSRAATVGDGILRLSDEDLEQYKDVYQQHQTEKEIVKFVPASGAASRMFKELFAFLDKPDLTDNMGAKTFVDGLNNFAFYEELKFRLSERDFNIEAANKPEDYEVIVNELLSEKGMGYGYLPKGLLSFHSYGEDGARTPVEEHFVEGAQYGKGAGNQVRLHFTVSLEHQAGFEEHVKQIKPRYEKMFDVQYEVTFSQQKVSTDTIAVDLQNEPFLDEGKLLFRPAGHGALLSNLDDLDADMVFIKNIDNVVPDHLKAPTILYKQVIGGVLMQVQQQVFALLEKLEQGGEPREAEAFIKETLGRPLAADYGQWSVDQRVSYLQNLLDRPVRVCGIVKNTGEPGGAPFWVQADDGSESLQLVEPAQIDMADDKQKEMFRSSTHFNPTDLVCGLKDRHGKAYDLMDYRDPSTGFISQKSKSGRDLKAQELPGLWNGSMAYWNSVMVEVPIETFNPVKTVNDLLKPGHQGEG